MKRIRIELYGLSIKNPLYRVFFSDFGAAMGFLYDLSNGGVFNEESGRYSVVCWNELRTPATLIKTYYTDDLTAEVIKMFGEASNS